MSTDNLPIVMDVEASGFGRGSYPIEIGFVMPDGIGVCVLIKPLPEWVHWDSQAEKLHRISQADLQSCGKEALEVAGMLNEWLVDKTVYSDAWGHDSSWLGMLFDSVGLVPRFRLQTIRYLLSEEQLKYWQQAKQQVAEELGIARHRASSDALIIQQAFRVSAGLAAGKPQSRSRCG